MLKRPCLKRPRLGRARQRDDQGLVAVLVAVITVPVLFGLGTLVIDVGSLYAEKRQLQNGADAAAYAVASGCVRSLVDCTSAASTAQGRANNNADDATSTVDEVCGSVGPTGGALSTCGATRCPQNPAATLPPLGTTFVRVTTSTRGSSGATVMPPLLSGALGFTTGSRVCAEATVSWGAPAGVTTVPLTFSQCEFNRLVPTGIPAEPGSGTAQILFHDGNSSDLCSAGRSNADAPGAFGFLSPDGSASCVVTVVNGKVPTSTGNAVPNPCTDTFNHAKQTAADPNRIANTTVLIPIFTAVTGNGSNVVYTISGYAAFFITGWNFNGQNYFPEKPAAPPCKGSETCIAGYFQRYVSLDDPLGTGPALYGLAVTKLTG